MTPEELLCRWAEEKYQLSAGSVASVEFYPYSCYEDGDTVEEGLELVVYGKGVLRCLTTQQTAFVGSLIREIIAFTQSSR